MKNILAKILIKFHLYELAANLYNGIHKWRLPKVLETKKKNIQDLPVRSSLKKKGESLNIVQISTVDNFGGAALVAFRLHKAYNRQGHNSVMFVGDKLSDDSKVIGIRDSAKDNQYLEMCRKEGLQYWNFLSSFDIPLKDEFKRADILQLHNLHGDFFNYLALPGLTRLKPTVWTLHDMQPLTGHCAFSLDCKKWETGCGACPYLDAYPRLERDTTAFLWQKKKDVFNQSQVELVVPSKWLLNIVKKSFLSEKRVHLIYNGIDTELFKPLPKLQMRKQFNIPPEALTFITSAAHGTKNPQKGGPLLIEALNRLKLKEKVVVVSVGDKNIDPHIEGIKWISTGHIFDEREIARWYSAADIFIYPSIADNCPLAVLEAQACGLPVVAFSTGGIPELVSHKETGYIAKYKNVADLLNGIAFFTEDKILLRRLGMEGRKRVEENFNVKCMVNSYLELYSDIIERRHSGIEN